MTDQRQWSRRQWLAAAGSTAAIGLAGCSSDDGTGGTDDGSTPAGNGGNGNGDTTNSDDTNSQSFEGPVTAEGDWMLENYRATNNRDTAAGGPPVPVQERWSQGLGEMNTSPLVVDDTVFASTADGTCYAFDLLSGEQRWQRDLGPETIYAHAADQDHLYVGQKDSLTALTHDNTVGWETTSIGFPSPTPADDTVYVFGSDVISAREQATGDEVWSTEFEGGLSAPAITDDRIVTKDTTYFKVFDATTGDRQVRVEHAGTIASNSVTVADGTAYFSADTDIEARSIDDGSLEWRWTDGTAEETVPAVADGVVYARPNGKTGPYRIDADTGENLGAVDVDGYTGPPVVANGTVFFSMLPDLESDDRIYAVSADSLEQRWQTTVPTQTPIQSPPIVLEDLVAYGTAGTLYVLDPA
jgi:outer membrane protein assembly factor BamB